MRLHYFILNLIFNINIKDVLEEYLCLNLFINHQICTRKGIVSSIAEETERLGSHALIIADEVVWNITEEKKKKVSQQITTLILNMKYLKENLLKKKFNV